MPSDPRDQDEDAALHARLKKLTGDLKGRAPPPLPPTSAKPAPPSDSTGAAMSLGMRAGSEFISAIIVGAAIGWGVDRLLHTSPAFLIAFFMLGVVAGVWNLIRLTSPKSASFGHSSPLSPGDTPDKDVRRAAAPPARNAPEGDDDDDED
jgi:ATP synthase protein I